MGIAGSTQGGFDLQVMLNPFEELFDLPLLFLDIPNLFGLQVVCVGNEQYSFSVAWSISTTNLRGSVIPLSVICR